MRVLFMGTPDFAAESLKSLIENGYEVVGAVTNPDKPKGRGHKMMFSPVKELALEHNIPVYQPVTLKDGAFSEVLNELKPDVICVTAYGRILPKYVLDYPKYGCINVHGSLLPKYRGAAPIQWCVINGEKTTGITTMKMADGIDTGDILLVEETEIGAEETAEELFDRLAVMGGKLLVKTLENIETIVPVPQDDSCATYASMIKKEMGNIDWAASADKICNLVRGMNSWPMAYTYYNGEPVKIISALPSDNDCGKAPGTIIGLVKGEGLCVACGNGSVIIRQVQFPGSKRMNVEDYMRGHSIESGVVLGG